MTEFQRSLLSIPLLLALAGCSEANTESEANGENSDLDGSNASTDPDTSDTDASREEETSAGEGGMQGDDHPTSDGGSPGSGGASSSGSGGDSASGGTSTGGATQTGAPLGTECNDDEDCESGWCDEGICLTTANACEVADVERSPGNNWSDSYSVDGKCYCATTFDHAIGTYEVETPVGTRTVREICDAIGPGPGLGDNPVYNDIQCGNGPANDAGDEDYCPGRVDQSDAGCCTVGPKWDLTLVE